MARHTTGKAKVLSDAQRRAVMAVLTTPRERAMFLLSVKAAMRAGEIAGIRWRHVRDDMLELTGDITKFGKPRSVPIARELREALDALRAEQQPDSDDQLLFPNRHLKGPKPMSPNAVAQWFRYVYRVRMGWEGYSSHSGRRTAITAMARKAGLAGGSIRDVQHIAGHANLSATQEYIEGSTDAKKKLVDLI